MAETLGSVTGASKKMRPDTAMGSLFRVPTIEYVVDEVALTHHADVYEMKIEETPVKIIAAIMLFLEIAGKFFAMLMEDQSSTTKDATRRMGIVSRLL